MTDPHNGRRRPAEIKRSVTEYQFHDRIRFFNYSAPKTGPDFLLIGNPCNNRDIFPAEERRFTGEKRKLPEVRPGGAALDTTSKESPPKKRDRRKIRSASFW